MNSFYESGPGVEAEVEEVEEVVEEQSSTPPIDYDRIGEGVAHALSRHQQAPAEQAPQQLTPEQEAEYFRRYQLNPEKLEEAFGEMSTPAARQELMTEIIEGLRQEMLRVNELTYGMTEQTLNSRLSPFEQMQMQATQRDFFGGIMAKYPVFKGKQAALQQAMKQMGAEGYKPTSADEAMEAVAKKAEMLAQTFNENFSLQGGSPQVAPAQKAVAPMMSGGGQRGTTQPAGGGNGAAHPLSTIYPKLAAAG